MNGYSYSKINTMGTAKSRSMDFSDLSLTFAGLKKPNTTTSLQPQEKHSKIIDHYKTTTENTTTDSFSVLLEEDQDQDQESNSTEENRFSMKQFRRNSSVSSGSAVLLQSAVKRALSIKRSSSVSERYCRIHDQSGTSAPPVHEDDTLDAMKTTTRSVKEKRSRGTILKICKKLFGL